MNVRLIATKRADLLSLAGATVAGTAVGALFPAVFAGAAVPLLLVGLIVHAVGMRSRYRLDRATGALPPLWRGLYAACWVTLAAVLVSSRGGCSLRAADDAADRVLPGRLTFPPPEGPRCARLLPGERRCS